MDLNYGINKSKTAFSEKIRIFSNDYLKCCRYISEDNTPPYDFTKKLYASLISYSHLLEDFLDFHGAKNNSNWYFYREFSAIVRHLSLASNSQKHILTRLNFYDLPDIEEFKGEGIKALDFLTDSLVKMVPSILVEAKRLNIAIPEERFTHKDFPGLSTGSMLDYDIDDEDKDQQKKNIIKIANEFLTLANSFDEFAFYEPYKIEEIKKIVPEKINEVEIRRIEMLVHNLQSSFDTYVIHGGMGFGQKKLKQKLFRSYCSVILHLLQMTGCLLHIYERHLYEVGYKNIYKKVQNQLAALIDPNILLNITVNYGLFYVCHFLIAGKELAKEILNENIERTSITVGIPVKCGFHSRPSLLVAKIVQYYGGHVELCVNNNTFDASSVLDIQWAGGMIQKENITKVIFKGDARALKDIQILSNVNYGEDTMGKGIPLPKELSYLK